MIGEDILEWINGNISVPNDLLDGLPPCPYARKTVLENKLKIIEYKGDDLAFFLYTILDLWDDSKDIILCAYGGVYIFQEVGNILNQLFNKQDLAVLISNPLDPFIINGVTTTFMGCPLVYIQRLSNLKKSSQELGKTGYYYFWTQDQIDKVVSWRN